jgi:Calcineurin-like phosphoesterase
MKKRAFKFIKYFFSAAFATLVILFIFALIFNQAIKYGFDKTIPSQLDREGPFIAFENDSLAKFQYIFGNKKEGFELQTQAVAKLDTTMNLPVYYLLDSSRFQVSVDFKFKQEPMIFPPAAKIFAVSDMEGNFKTFRDLLIANEVIDESQNWSFGDGHLVLLGDFMDKGFFVTQTLWFIYKLEKEAAKSGGKVHYILGNHEINNLQGYHRSTAQKYWYITNILGLKRHEFYGQNSYLGRWLATKNVVEKIGSFVFTHGGLHPDFAENDLSLEEINEQIKSNYRTPFYNKKGSDANYDLLFSTKKSPSWYRGYFNEKLSQQKIDNLLQKFEASQIIVGHTTVPKVGCFYNEKVIGIDVKSPQDHLKYFPERRTEALLLENGIWYRVNDNGLKKKL